MSVNVAVPSTVPQRSPELQATMDRLAAHHRALQARIAAERVRDPPATLTCLTPKIATPRDLPMLRI